MPARHMLFITAIISLAVLMTPLRQYDIADLIVFFCYFVIGGIFDASLYFRSRSSPFIFALVAIVAMATVFSKPASHWNLAEQGFFFVFGILSFEVVASREKEIPIFCLSFIVSLLLASVVMVKV